MTWNQLGFVIPLQFFSTDKAFLAISTLEKLIENLKYVPV